VAQFWTDCIIFSLFLTAQPMSIFLFFSASLPGGPHLSALSSLAAVAWNLTAASWNPITAA
jgi:hypothetical protein